jgi:hypothetical protein
LFPPLAAQKEDLKYYHGPGYRPYQVMLLKMYAQQNEFRYAAKKYHPTP